MRSLAVKLFLALLLVGMVAVALVGGFVSLQTLAALDRFSLDRELVSLTSALQSHYSTNGSWRGVESVFQGGKESAGAKWLRRSVAVVDTDRRLVYGAGDLGPGGRSLGQRDLEHGIPLTAGGQAIGWLVVGRNPPPANVVNREPEDVLRERIGSAIVYAVLGAVGLALVFAAVLARGLARPIQELMAGTQALSRGRLGQQVPVRSQDELGQLAISFNRMSADLARTSEARRQMTADIAHELRTPLSVIAGYAEALQDGKLQGGPAAYAAIHDTSRRLQGLVDDLGTLALADAGELPLNRRTVDPRALLERAVLAHSAQAQAGGVELRIEAALDLPSVYVDPDRLTQVFDNLMANALRYTPAGGTIELAARTDPKRERLLIEVRDTGSGIAEADLPFVFDRFYRADRSRKAEQRESGLGLAIARSIVEGHGGEIRVASVSGEGTVFTVELPFDSGSRL